MAIAGAALVLSEFIKALWPKAEPAELEQRALTELALVRDEISKLRGDTLRDRDELRDAVSKHDRAFVNVTNQVNDCIKVSTNLSMQLSNQVRR